MTTANDFLMGSGTKSAKFMGRNNPVQMTITRDPEVRQQTDFDSGELKTFKNGDPMMQLVVVGTTDQRDPDKPDDDGTRAFYIKGKHMKGVVGDAVRAAGARGLEVGGVLTMTWVSGGPRYEGDTTWTKESPKVYSAAYVKPAGASAAFFATEEPAPVQQSATAAPAGDPAMPPNFDPATWAVLDKDQRAKVRAAMGLA